MADTGKQSPLGINVLGGQLQNLGFYINPTVESYAGQSKSNETHTFGKLLSETVLKPLAYAINDAYQRSIKPGSQLAQVTGYIDGETLHITAVTSGSIIIGALITGSGVLSNSRIVSQVTGSIGGVGSYVLDTFQSVGTSTSPITLYAFGIIDEWHAVSLPGTWGTFLNNYGIWSGSDTAFTTKSYNASIAFPRTGLYTITVQADDYLIVLLDYDTPVYIGITGIVEGEEKSIDLQIRNGIHVITMIVTNVRGVGAGAITVKDSTGSTLWTTRTNLPSTVNGPTVSNNVYNSLINIGKDTIPALGNTPPYSYTNADPARKWWGQATTGYYLTEDPTPAQGQSQTATWIPYNTTNKNVGVTQWGYYRLFALQAWNEFNWNGIPLGSNMPEYKDFTASFLTSDAFIKYSNVAINAALNSTSFLQGTYSNMNDLISGDITGVTLATREFGADCIALGRVIDLSKIQTFGLPSVLLQTIKRNKILTQSLSFALIAAGLTTNNINDISSGNLNPVPKDFEQKIYGAYLLIVGNDLQEILFALNCKTQGLESLADLLNVKKIFPNSYKSLTVPIYNAYPGPTNSKTYYPIFDGDSVSPRIQAPEVKEQIGEIIPPGPPPIVELPIETPPPPSLPETVVPITELPTLELPAIIPEPEVVVPVVVAEPVIPEVLPAPTLLETLIIEPPPPPPVIVPAAPPEIETGLPVITPTVEIEPYLQGGGGCVVLESYIPLCENKLFNSHQIRQAYQLLDEYKILLADETTLTHREGIVIKAAIEQQPCVRIVTEDKTSLVCSTTAPIPTLDGIVHAPYLLEKYVAVYRNEKTYWSKVTLVEDVGIKFVRAIDTGNNSFWAGEVDGAYILHHNTPIRITGENAEIRKN